MDESGGRGKLDRISKLADRDLLIALRQAILMFVDAIERYLDINPRTADLRKRYG